MELEVGEGGAALSQAQLNRLVGREAIEELYRRIPTIIIGQLLITLIIVAGIWSYHGALELLAWMAAIYLVLGQRFLLLRRYRREGYEPRGEHYWGRQYAFGALLLGILLGLGGFLFFYAESLGHQLLLFSIIIGLTISGINTNSVWPTSYYAYVIPSIGLLALRMILEGSVEYMAMGLGLLVYIPVASRIAHSANATFRKTVLLHFRNLELVEQLRQEKARVEEASQAKTRFLASASHDLRQPIHSMALFSEALAAEVDSERGRQMLGYIDTALDGLSQLLGSLLDISKLDAGVIEPERRAIPLRGVLENLATEFRSQAEEKGLTLRLHVLDVTVDSDPTLLANIVRNLLSNAVRYTERGGILLATRHRGGRVLLQVWDSGCGILAEEQALVFEEFRQLDNPERDRSKGLGLGLSICRRLAELLDHPLHLCSRPGNGTLFTLELPLAPVASSEAVTQGASRTVEIQQGERRLLVIDDERSVRQGMALVLRQWGYRVHTADGISSALEESVAAEGRIDAILADYRLRDNATGVEAIEAINRRLGREVPALLLTGDTAPERIQEARSSGYLLLHKPIKPQELHRHLVQLLDTSPA